MKPMYFVTVRAEEEQARITRRMKEAANLANRKAEEDDVTGGFCQWLGLARQCYGGV
jgi:hypothetical protein